jgi:hypothetical protein
LADESQIGVLVIDPQMAFIGCFIPRGFFCCLCGCASGVVYDLTRVAPNSSKEEEKLQGSNQRPAEWRLERCELTTKKEIYSTLSRLI